MGSFDIHIKKYQLFLKDATNQENSEPTRIEAFFESAFHLIEAVVAKSRVHINKHQLLRTVLGQHKGIFGDNTEKVWRAFQEIENQIRPGQAYGGAINGEALKRTEELVNVISKVCETTLGLVPTLRKTEKKHFRETR